MAWVGLEAYLAEGGQDCWGLDREEDRLGLMEGSRGVDETEDAAEEVEGLVHDPHHDIGDVLGSVQSEVALKELLPALLDQLMEERVGGTEENRLLAFLAECFKQLTPLDATIHHSGR